MRPIITMVNINDMRYSQLLSIHILFSFNGHNLVGERLLLERERDGQAYLICVCARAYTLNSLITQILLSLFLEKIQSHVFLSKEHTVFLWPRQTHFLRRTRPFFSCRGKKISTGMGTHRINQAKWIIMHNKALV